MSLQLGMRSSAEFSEDKVYRYVLKREWGDGSPLVYIMLNPSTADETQNDPTIRRCIDHAQRFEFGGLHVLNLFAFRATDPRQLYKAVDPIGPENDEYIREYVKGRQVIVAWGNHGAYMDRASQVGKMLGIAKDVYAFRFTKKLQPAHPLYLPKSLEAKAL